MPVRVSRRTALLAPLAVAAGCLTDPWDTLPDTSVTIATGNPGGVFARYGEALSEVVTNRLDGLTSTTRLTDASVENLHLVSDGTCDVGFSLGDVASDAIRGSGVFESPQQVVALARTYDSFVHLVVRTDSGIKEVTDLRGRRVGIGAPSSGTRVVARRLLTRAGVRLSEIEVRTASLEASAAALGERRLDAFFFVSGLPNQAVLSLSDTVAIRLLDLGGLVRAMTSRFGPEYAAGPVPSSTYAMPSAVETISVKNYIVVHPQMPDEVAYALTRVMFEGQAEIERLAPDVRQPNLGAAVFTSPLDLHPGSVRYYRERRP